MAEKTQKELMSTYATTVLQVITYKKLQTRINAVLKQYELNMTQWIILGRLKEKQSGLRTTDLARFMHVEVPLITMVAQPLMGRGLIDSNKISHDKRAKLLSLTDNANKLVDMVEKRLQAQVKDIMKDVSVQDMNAYFRVLQTMVQNP
ncbi:MAG TPA: MarR family transcriptional regulator [Candidatus Saccharimonadales bacterium]|nr:MarR family transcriptional regulator [Candidatus Saccharimonadales bacterium]